MVQYMPEPPYCRGGPLSTKLAQAPGSQRQAEGPGQGRPASGPDPAPGTAAGGPPSSGPPSIRSMFTGLGGLLGSSLAPAKVLHTSPMLPVSMVSMFPCPWFPSSMSTGWVSYRLTF